MRNRVALVVYVLLFQLAMAPSGQAKPLRAGGVEVKFINWDPVAASYSYRKLQISGRHRKELVEKGEQYMIPLYHIKLHFLANGDVEELSTYSRYLLNQEGVHNYGNQSFWVDAYASRTSIIQAYSLLPNGKRIGVDPDAIQILTDQDEDIFSDSFKVIVPYSNLRKDSIQVLQIRTLHLAARDTMPWSKVYYPQSFHVRDKYVIEMEWDNNKVKPVWKSDYPNLRCQEKGRTATCMVVKSEPFDDDPDIPRYEDTLPQFIVSKKIKWRKLVSDMESVVDSRLDDSQAIRAKAMALVAGAKNEREKVQRLYEFVADKIRYVGLEHGSGGIVPRHTEHTFSRGYGDCKDKASLFVNMARMVGLDAYPVLTSTRRRNADKVLLPAASYFDHMIACVNPRKGSDICVDLTNPYSSSRQLSGSMQGAIRLDIRHSANRITNLPKKSHVWDIQVKAVNRFTKSGAIQEDLKVIYNAATATWARGILRPMTRSERTDWGVDNYHDAVSSSAKPKVSIAGVANTTKSVVVSSKTEYKGIVKKYSDFKRYSEDESWLKYYYSNKKSGNKSHPYIYDGMHYHSEVKYTLPDGYVIAYVGAEIDFDTPYGHFVRKYKKDDGEVTVLTEFSLPNNTVPVSELHRFNHFIDAVLANQRMEFGIESE